MLSPIGREMDAAAAVVDAAGSASPPPSFLIPATILTEVLKMEIRRRRRSQKQRGREKWKE